MIDTRELILARLAVVCAAVEGVAAVERNRLDASGLARPAVIIHDGDENVLDRGGSEASPSKGNRFSAVQTMLLAPDLEIHFWAEAVQGGPVVALYRNRIVWAVLNDTTLRELVGANGNIAYRSFAMNRPPPEGRERRADLVLQFAYTFRLSDLAGG